MLLFAAADLVVERLAETRSRKNKPTVPRTVIPTATACRLCNLSHSCAI